MTPIDVRTFTAAALPVAIDRDLPHQRNAALTFTMRLCIGGSRRGELSDSADRTDDHYQRAKQHASSAADNAGDAVDEASTSAARRFGI